jgi:undecaprenyl-diphosphatase
MLARAIRAPVRGLRLALDWIGRYEPAVIAAMLVLVAAVWALIEIADEVFEGSTQNIDERLVLALRRANDLSQPIGPQWLAELGRDITALGGAAILTGLTLAVAGFLWLRKMYGAMWLVLASTCGGIVVSTILKNAFDRPRPDIVPHLSHVHTSSFPSGHAMLSATVFLTLGTLLGRFATELRLKAYFLLIAVLLTLAVGASRVYMGVHYPTDVLAGWCAGLAWALVCWLVARNLQRRGAVEHGLAAAHEETASSRSSE